MRTYGLIGYPLGHSFSKRYFDEKFASENITNCRYENFPLESISMFPGLLLKNPDLAGLNVTIPYKEKIIDQLDGLSPEAAAIGAVNCIAFVKGKLTGHNTDAYGFRRSLLEFIGHERPAALVLGTGGAAKAVKYVLKELGIEALSVSRTSGDGRLTYDDLDPETVGSHKLIVNTTPLGTFPDTGKYPSLPYEALTPEHYLYDLVYNPAQTQFLHHGRSYGAKTANGYPMLTGQAEKAWEIWQQTVL